MNALLQLLPMAVDVGPFKYKAEAREGKKEEKEGVGRGRKGHAVEFLQIKALSGATVTLV